MREAILQVLGIVFETSKQSSQSQSLPVSNSDPASTSASASTSHNWDIYITGHSLGGALASLMAFELGLMRVTSSNRNSSSDLIGTLADAELAMYSYGAPRVGNAEFVKVSQIKCSCYGRGVSCIYVCICCE